MELAIQLVR